MKKALLHFAAVLALTPPFIAPAFAQVGFQGYVTPTQDARAPEIKKHSDSGNWYNGEEFVPRVLTLGIKQTPKNLLLPESTLIVPGSGTIPNSAFLSAALGTMGFEAPITPYVVLDNFTHSYVEVYSFEDLTGFLRAQADGSIFVLGLDFQSGFIRKENGQLTYLSSTDGASPRSEPLETAVALKDGDIFVIGDLSERARIVIGVDSI